MGGALRPDWTSVSDTSGHKAPPTCRTNPLRPRPGYSSLRQHRWSAPDSEYFVTFKAQRPTDGLMYPEILCALTQRREYLEAIDRWNVRTWVVMPDHIHVVFTLGRSTSLAQCFRDLKGPLTPSLRRKGVRWQEGYYEHRIRQDEDRLPVFLYVFLNPYRARLLAQSERWPGYFCSEEDWAWLRPLTNSDTAFPEWLR